LFILSNIIKYQVLGLDDVVKIQQCNNKNKNLNKKA
jgi:hypothetical protein